MPYLTEADKQKLSHITTQIVMADIKTPGHLNYLFTKIVLQYLEIHGIKYQVFNDAIGALEACKMELYRRLVGRYEDTKIKTNGEVYTDIYID